MTDAEIRVALYRDFVSAGRAPSAARLAEICGFPIDEMRAALERLDAGRVIVLQPESREILFAAPLSAVPTPYVVRMQPLPHGRGSETGPVQISYFAPCIWDALAVIGMIRTDGSVETSCPCCGEAMTITVSGGRVVTAPGVVHFGLPARKWWEDIVFT